MRRESGKALIIAEKPSVARDIVAALGGFSASASPSVPHTTSSREGRSAQVWESDAFICTHALGHVLDLYEPEDYQPSFKIWKFSDLPIVPPHFLLKPKSETAPILRTIKQLLLRPDVTAVINACDAAREGELIFREIIENARLEKPHYRVWLQSLTHEAIRSAFQNLKPGEEFSGLAAAAHGRSNADWLVGMNLSRAMTLKLARASQPGVWSVGRVQTPTLAMLVDREFQILAHDPRPYEIVRARFKAKDHTYEGVWFDPKNSNLAAAKQIFDPAHTKQIIAVLGVGSVGDASEVRKSREQVAPPLFHLTGLQRYMANHHKWTAKQTLTTAQKCYEQHKIITYPRTESLCLPEDYQEKVLNVFKTLAHMEDYRSFAKKLSDPTSWQNTTRNFDSKSIKDHFAIIPTGIFPNALPPDESLLFDAIIRRTAASFMPPAVIDQVERTTVVLGESFKSGPEEIVRIPGWQEATATVKRKTEFALKPLGSESEVTLLSTEVKTDRTKPPPRIGEAQLLTMMEHAGRQVEDPDMAKALHAAGGLGTAATRAEIIENLKSKGFIFASLQPTVKGMHLIRYLKLARAEPLTSPVLTAEMESKLLEVEEGRRTKELFLDETVSSVRQSLAAVERFNVDVSFRGAPALGACPRCLRSSGADTPKTVHERMWNYSCASNFDANLACGFTLPKDLDGRYLDPATVGRLLAADGTDGILVEGFPTDEKHGGTERRLIRLKNAQLEVLTSTGEPVEPLHGSSDRTTLTRRTTWGPCPVHKGDACLIIETKQAFICETRLRHLKAGEDAGSGFYLPKLLCGRALKYDEIQSFIRDGRTKKIEGFKSKGGKAFAASIIRSPTGQWSLDFQ